ncbi:hypothetical protein DWF00_16670 [Bosea caraganae]|uniref:Uncharacterized protein n=1 Tax=Bosea caraganae TaxID=2763117 RepID=A0A370KZX4_9HYPH|nr:hypothetical protein DWE98_26270 [Bosea caraganae]RDJ24855.1 hypothetical protein DWF00_16670 [Bosea caraganae]
MTMLILGGTFARPVRERVACDFASFSLVGELKTYPIDESPLAIAHVDVKTRHDRTFQRSNALI